MALWASPAQVRPPAGRQKHNATLLSPTSIPRGDEGGNPYCPKTPSRDRSSHAIALLIIVAIIIHAVTNAWWALAGWLLVANVVANVYPIMLQRHNRARLLPVLEKLRAGIAGN